MILPPSVLRVRIVESGRRKLRLWIPMFLVWPIVIALMIVLSPVALIVFISWSRARDYIKAGPQILGALWAMRGLRVDVGEHQDGVFVSLD